MSEAVLLTALCVFACVMCKFACVMCVFACVCLSVRLLSASGRRPAGASERIAVLLRAACKASKPRTYRRTSLSRTDPGRSGHTHWLLLVISEEKCSVLKVKLVKLFSNTLNKTRLWWRDGTVRIYL